MMRTMRTAALAGLLAMAGIAATADRASAQYYYSYYPGTTYYYNTTPLGGYQTYYNPGMTTSYYSPFNNTSWNWTSPGYTYSSYYTTPYTGYTVPYTSYSTMPYTAWNGSTAYSPYYSPPVVDTYNTYYNTYRTARGFFRR